jgi:hypothetical protein
MGWGVEVLVEGLLGAECLIALVAFGEATWGIEVLLQCPLIITGSITRLTVLGHFAQRLLQRCSLSWKPKQWSHSSQLDASSTSASL